MLILFNDVGSVLGSFWVMFVIMSGRVGVVVESFGGRVVVVFL